MKFCFSNILMKVVLVSLIPSTQLLANSNKHMYCEGSDVPAKWQSFPVTFQVDMDDFNASQFHRLNVLRSRINMAGGNTATIRLEQANNVFLEAYSSFDGINSIGVADFGPNSNVPVYTKLTLECDGPNANTITGADIAFNSAYFPQNFDERTITQELLYSLGLNKNNSNLNTHMNTAVGSDKFVFVGSDQIWPTSIDAQSLRTLYPGNGLYMFDFQVGKPYAGDNAVGWGEGGYSYVSAPFKIQNTGYFAADLGARFYLSTDKNITSNDYYLGERSWTVNHAPASVQSNTIFQFVGADVAEGEYYVGIWTDEMSYYSETNEGNNKAILGKITVNH